MVFFLSVRWRVTSPTRQLADTFSDLMTTLINSIHSRKVANLFVQMISIRMSAFWPMVSASWWSVSWHVGEVTGYLTLMALVLIVLLWKHSKQNWDILTDIFLPTQVKTSLDVVFRETKFSFMNILFLGFIWRLIKSWQALFSFLWSYATSFPRLPRPTQRYAVGSQSTSI